MTAKSHTLQPSTFAAGLVLRFKTFGATPISAHTLSDPSYPSEPCASSQNDDLTNGLALSKNPHWMFDEGLWSVGNDGRIAVAKHRLTENGPDQPRLTSYGGRFLQFADGISLRPAPQFFQRHRQFHGLTA